MNLTDMHIMFRQFAQQMGMQNTRAILPEQIDLLLNTSISDITDEIVRTNVGITNDRVVTDNSKISQINALRTLYKVKEIAFNDVTTDNESDRITISINSFNNNDVLNIYLCSNAEALTYDEGEIGTYKANVVKQYSCKKEDLESLVDDYPDYISHSSITGNYLYLRFHEINAGNYVVIFVKQDNSQVTYNVNNSTIEYEASLGSAAIKTFTLTAINPFIFKKSYAYSGRFISNPDYTFPNYRFLVDFSINYIKSDVGYFGKNTISLNEDEDFISNYFPVRIIDDAYLAEAQQDYVLKARLRTPVISIYNNSFDLYIDTLVNEGKGYLLDNGLLPYKLRMAYIAEPAKVKYVEDYGDSNVECDLPESLHVNIVKHAVELWNDSIRGSVATEQTKQQRAQQERYRNQNRNEQD